MAQPRELEALTSAVEKRFGRGPVEDWSQRDFELLSKEVELSTHQLLSVTTLKRVLGRITFDGRPLLHTLNTLSLYTGTESWGRFTEQLYQSAGESHNTESAPPVMAEVELGYANSSSTAPGGSPEYQQQSRRPEYAAPAVARTSPSFTDTEREPTVGSNRLRFIYGLAALGLILAIGLYLMWPSSQPAQAPSSKALSKPAGILTVVLPEAEVLPYKVQFIYHGPLLPKESLNLIMFEKGQMQYIGTSPKGRGHASHSYTEPGMYWPKVVSNKELIAQIPLVVPSQGWYCQVRQKKIVNRVERALYMPRPQSASAAALLNIPIGLDLKGAHANGIDTSKPYYTVYNQTRDYHASSDAFTFQAEITCPDGIRAGREGVVIFKFMGKLGSFHLQLAARRDLSGLYEQISEVTLDSATAYDKLRRLRVPTFGTHTYKVQVDQGSFVVFFDGKSILSQPYTQPIGELYAVEVATTGPSTVRNQSVQAADLSLSEN